MTFGTNAHQLRTVLESFFVLPEIKNFDILPGGHIHQTYRLTVESQFNLSSIIIQKLNTSVFADPEKIMQNIKLVADHLQSKKTASPSYEMNVLSPLQTQDGHPGLWLDGDYWRIFPFFADALCTNAVENQTVAYSAGQAFGSFSFFLSDMDSQVLHETIVGFHCGQMRIEQFKEAFRQDRAKRKGRILELAQELHGHLPLLETFDRLRHNMPKRVVHHDAKLNNVLLNRHSLVPVAVIDLDTVMEGCILSDYGDLVRSLTCPHAEDAVDAEIHMNQDFFESLTRGYLEACGPMLTDVERAHLPFGASAITLMVAIRFLADYLNGDRYFATRYATQNLDRAINQFTLYKEFRSKQADMKAYIDHCMSC